MSNIETSRVLPDLSQLTREQLIAQIEALKSAPANRLTCKVSEKGAICVYGLGRFPVTLYASQWERLLASAEMIKSFAKANASKLATKS